MNYITIEYIHVGKLSLSLFDRLWYMPHQVGMLQQQDIGKRLYCVRTGTGGYTAYTLQMENNEQRAARMEVRRA